MLFAEKHTLFASGWPRSRAGPSGGDLADEGCDPGSELARASHH